LDKILTIKSDNDIINGKTKRITNRRIAEQRLKFAKHFTFKIDDKEYSAAGVLVILRLLIHVYYLLNIRVMVLAWYSDMILTTTKHLYLHVLLKNLILMLGY